jgi:hypothetical protein
MRCLTVPVCVLGALAAGAGLLRLATRAALHPDYGPGFHHAWPLAFMGVGLLLAGASLAVRVGLEGRALVLHRAARLALLAALSLGTTLALLGLAGALTSLL